MACSDDLNVRLKISFLMALQLLQKSSVFFLQILRN